MTGDHPVDSALMLPVGHPLGPVDDPATGYRVRVGPDLVTLSVPRFAVWGLAHGTPDRDEDALWGRAHVLAAAAALDLGGDPEEILESLLDDGLLAEVEPGTDDVVDFGRRHRLVPLMLGLGNTADEPGVFQVGLPGTPILSLSGHLFDLYKWAHLSEDLATAVTLSLAMMRNGDLPVPDDPDAVLEDLVGALHLLLGPSAAYLDTRRLG